MSLRKKLEEALLPYFAMELTDKILALIREELPKERPSPSYFPANEGWNDYYQAMLEILGGEGKTCKHEWDHACMPNYVEKCRKCEKVRVMEGAKEQPTNDKQ